MHRAIVDLPHPDSPTTPSVSPSRTVKLTPSTAFTDAISFWKMMPCVTGKCFLTSSTTSSSSPARRRPRRPPSSSGLSITPARSSRRLPVLRLLVEPARLQVVRLADRRRELGMLALADVHDVGAARMEPAAARRVEQRRRLALDLDEPLDVGVEPRERAEQPPRVRVLRALEDLVDGRPARRSRPAYITTTSSAISATTPRSCVIMMIALPNSSCSFSISARIWAWVVTSSAVVGSSAISRSGLLISAIAIIARWRMPPENWCG